ncbi:hypothetical protein E2C01_085035 [Portunus trituberculatus]|uniref:Uncharacterized protein n=1 Tax=Portunus trituberculatus TaxID=210409 RepID=A0A5B7JAV7_PORTR|nr:hypothetical protein [Portunus trituberculatus]
MQGVLVLSPGHGKIFWDDCTLPSPARLVMGTAELKEFSSLGLGLPVSCGWEREEGRERNRQASLLRVLAEGDAT